MDGDDTFTTLTVIYVALMIVVVATGYIQLKRKQK
jgi:hypothetical protein